MAPALLKAVTLATCVKAFLLPGIAPHDYQPGAGPKSNAKRDRGARAARRAQIDPPVGGRDSRLHGLGRARRRARRGRGGLPRVAQVPRVHLRADQVRLGRRVPLSPFPGLVREVSLLEGVVDRVPCHAVGEASSSELDPSSQRNARLKFNTPLVSLLPLAESERQNGRIVPAQSLVHRSCRRTRLGD